LINLLSNAARYVDEGGVTIRADYQQSSIVLTSVSHLPASWPLISPSRKRYDLCVGLCSEDVGDPDPGWRCGRWTSVWSSFR
jgi:hypothetical protein